MSIMVGQLRQHHLEGWEPRKFLVEKITKFTFSTALVLDEAWIIYDNGERRRMAAEVVEWSSQEIL